MADDAEQLLVLVEARIRDFDRKMIQAERRGTKTYGSLKRSSGSATARMERDMNRATGRINVALSTTSSRIGAVSTAMKGFLAGAAVAGAGYAVREINNLAQSIAEVGDQAERAGVSAEAFQEWKFVAEQNRIGIDSMVDGLKELNLRADEFVVTGKGPAAEAFQRLGFSADQLAAELENPSELLLKIIDRLGKMDRAAQIRVSDELFGGTAGERFVELLDQGEEGIRRTIDRAHELGVVMDDEMIAKADEVNRRFNEIATTVGVKLKSAIVSAADSLAGFLDGFREFEQQRNSTLEDRINQIIRERAQLVEERKRIEAVPEGRPGRAGRIQQYDDAIRGLTAEEDELIGILQRRTTPQWQPRNDPWTPPETGSGGGGGGARRSSGGGGGNPFEDRLTRLMEALMTERQVLDQWYAEGEEILNERRAQELLGEQQHRSAILALEEEYRARLRSIQARSNSGALAETATFFGSMAAVTAAGGNKLLRVTRTFAAVEALINTFRAQSQVLADPTLGFFGKMAAYAAIGAAGLQTVAAIKGSGGGGSGSGFSVGSTGSSRTSSGSSYSTAQAANPAPLDVRIEGISPEQLYSGNMIIELLDRLNDEAGNRGLRLLT